jgi:hypothetical protein
LFHFIHSFIVCLKFPYVPRLLNHFQSVFIFSASFCSCFVCLIWSLSLWIFSVNSHNPCSAFAALCRFRVVCERMHFVGLEELMFLVRSSASVLFRWLELGLRSCFGFLNIWNLLCASFWIFGPFVPCALDFWIFYLVFFLELVANVVE